MGLIHAIIELQIHKRAINNYELRITNYENKKPGFTLVETMVAVSITLIMSTGLLILANSFLAGEKVKQAAAEMVSYLNSARNMAVTGQSPAGFAMEYVAVIVAADGKISAYPANVGGTRAAFFSKKISDSKVQTTSINFGGLQFAVGSGKFVGLDAKPLAVNSIGISVVSPETNANKNILINAFGTITVQ